MLYFTVLFLERVNAAYGFNDSISVIMISKLERSLED